jgi:hypothetical protein
MSKKRTEGVYGYPVRFVVEFLSCYIGTWRGDLSLQCESYTYPLIVTVRSLKAKARSYVLA